MAKQKKKVKKDLSRFKLHVPTGPMKAPLEAVAKLTNAELCEQLNDQLNNRLLKNCAAKEFEQTSGNCAAGGATQCVDLVVVIDTSGSMQDEATDLSAAADAAIQAAAQSCPSDLRVAWFGIEGTWTGTKFTQSYRDYLHGLGVPDADIVGRPVGTVPGQGAQEDGAAAVMDISDHFDWRPGCERAIFYLGDEALEGGDPQDPADTTAREAAVSVANANSVKVFTYLGTHPAGPPNPDTVTDYAKLATDTGGQAFVAPVANLGGFQQVLENIICASISQACQPIDEPKVVPCLRLRWGDGPNDRLETEDTEILCITVCNPYSNVTLKNFTLHLVVTDATGAPVTNLPDGTPSVQIKPEFMICFGDIPPCDPKRQDQPSCVSREVVLLTRGAIEGKYQIFSAYCFQTCFTQLGFGTTFDLDLVKS